MTKDYDYIENYLAGNFSAEETAAFENRIITDPAFAEDFAFYITAMRAAGELAADERKTRFRNFYAAEPSAVPARPAIIRRFAPWLAAAAAVAVIVISLFIFFPSSSPSQLADAYLAEHNGSLSTTMDRDEGSLKTGVNLYNEGKFEAALGQFDKCLATDPTDPRAKENAGRTALQLRRYDKALTYFVSLESDTTLYANPGKFYRALTLLKRNQPGDPDEAKKLLQDVVKLHLDLDNEAKDLLKKL